MSAVKRKNATHFTVLCEYETVMESFGVNIMGSQ